MNRLERLAEALRPVSAEEAAGLACLPDVPLDLALRHARLTRQEITTDFDAVEANPMVMRHLLRMATRQGMRGATD